MHKQHLIPGTTPPKKLILFSQFVIRTLDIPDNNFDVGSGY
jgi:hypothetical protein